jgi:hypothetical protein
MSSEPYSYTPPETASLRPLHDSYWVIPDRLLAGEYPGVSFSPEITRRRLAAFLDGGFDTMINLTCEGEVLEYAPLLTELAGARGRTVDCLQFPISDYGMPSVLEMRAVLDAIDQALKAGHKVYVHCQGGIGRTGTTVGCYLVRHGLSGARALQQLAAWWRMVPKSKRFPNSPETLEQEKFVLNWREAQE